MVLSTWRHGFLDHVIFRLNNVSAFVTFYGELIVRLVLAKVDHFYGIMIL